MEQQKEYTGTWIPAHIMQDNELDIYAKFLYAELASSSKLCLDKYSLSKILGCSEKMIDNKVKLLKDKKYIN